MTQVGTNKTEKEIKFLGVLIDQNLTWKPHINNILNKTAKSIYVINKMKHFVPSDTLKTLYYTLIHPHFTYGIYVWGNSTQINKIQLQQKRCIRLINKKSYRAHTEPLFTYITIHV